MGLFGISRSSLGFSSSKGDRGSNISSKASDGSHSAATKVSNQANDAHTKKSQASDARPDDAKWSDAGLSSSQPGDAKRSDGGTNGARLDHAKQTGEKSEDEMQGTELPSDLNAVAPSESQSVKKTKATLNATSRLMQLHAQMVQKSIFNQDSHQQSQNDQTEVAARQEDGLPVESGKAGPRDVGSSRDGLGKEAGSTASDTSGQQPVDSALWRSLSSVPVQPIRKHSLVGLPLAGPVARASTLRRPGASSSEPEPPAEAEVKALFKIMQGNAQLQERRTAVEKLRGFSKLSRMHRFALGSYGAVPVLINLLNSEDDVIIEHAVTTLLNLALELPLKIEIGNTSVIPTLLQMMKTSRVKTIRENAAGALCNLSVAEQNRATLRGAGIIPPLVELLHPNESLLVRRDAAVGLFNMAIDPACREDIVQLETAKIVLAILDEPDLQFEEEAVTLLASLMKVPEALETVDENDGVATLVGVLEGGAPRAQASAVAALLLFAESSEERRQDIINEGIFPSLNAISEGGTARGREKAAALLKILRGC